MPLQKLVEYNQRQESRPSLYSEGPVRYIVHLDHDGRFQGPLIDYGRPFESSHQARPVPADSPSPACGEHPPAVAGRQSRLHLRPH